MPRRGAALGAAVLPALILHMRMLRMLRMARAPSPSPRPAPPASHGGFFAAARGGLWLRAGFDQQRLALDLKGEVGGVGGENPRARGPISGHQRGGRRDRGQEPPRP
jgi:hypothetical protein